MKKDFNTGSEFQSKPLKVLFVTHNYIRQKDDFAGVFLHLLAKKLLENNIEIHVIAPHDNGIPEYEEMDGIRIHRFRYANDINETLAYRGDMHRQIFRNPFKIFRLYRFLKSSYKLASKVIEKEDISVVSVHWMVPCGVVGRWLKKKYKGRIKLFLSSHGTDIRLITRFSFLFNYLKPMIKKANGWTVVSNYLRQLLLEKDDSLANKIRVIPLPNDETVFYPDDSIIKDGNLIAAVSRLTVQKRLDYLIQAVGIVRKNNPKIKLEIYGSGPEKENLEKQIKAHDLKENITILKPIPQEELRKIYNKASVVILNSINEGFGLVLTEAMLCRTAVIGADSGGITDIIDNEKTGYLVPPDNSEELADAIARLLEDNTLRERLTEAGYRKALAEFSSNSTAVRYARLFRG